MSEVSLIWCHGSESQPWGNKSTSLADVANAAGLSMEAPDFQELPNADDRVNLLTERLLEIETPTILAGSSMGGYVAAAAAKNENVLGLFLLAPAFYLPGYAIHVFSGLPKFVTIIHGWEDEVVPVENSIRFAKLHKADLHILNDGHRLENRMVDINSLFAHFLATVKP